MAAPSFQVLLLCFSLSLFFSYVHSSSFVFSVSKDLSTHQYLATVYHGSPIKPLHLTLDLGGPILWMNCESAPRSLSRRPIPSRSIQCLTATAGGVTDRRSGSDGACDLVAANPIADLEGRGVLVEDTVAVRSLESSSAAMIVAVHSCAPQYLLRGLAINSRGILGLGRSQISLPAQIATDLGFHRRFTVCLSSSNGVVFPDDGNHDSVFGSQISSSLTYTPLLTSKIDGSQSPDYFINVKAIKVNGNRLPLNKSLLVLDDGGGGGGGTRLSTVVPYTTLESSIFAALTAVFKEAAAEMKMREAAAVAPFELCFRSETMEMSPTGPKVPEIELMLQSEMVGWKINGRNSMVKVSDEIMCLGFVNGGSKVRNSIVLGGFQMEDVLLNFDMGTSMLGFSSSLLQKKRSCSEFWSEESPEEMMM